MLLRRLIFKHKNLNNQVFINGEEFKLILNSLENDFFNNIDKKNSNLINFSKNNSKYNKFMANTIFFNDKNEINTNIIKNYENHLDNSEFVIEFIIEKNKYPSLDVNFFNKLSALLHDLKHIVYDNMIYFDYLVLKYIHPLISNQDCDLYNKSYKNNRSNNQEIYKIKDELIYLSVIKNFTISLILNITGFMSQNEFLTGSLDEKIDYIGIINLMVKIFNRRLEYENEMIEKIDLHSNSNLNININTNSNFISKKKNLVINSKIFNIDSILKCKMISNQNLIISLLYNIISNSYKYTDVGEISIEADICKIDEIDYILIKISDTGKGISQEILNNWGKPFNFQDKNTGTGLGQFLIDSISKKIGIKILKPEKNQFSTTGTVIKLLIPILKITDNSNNIDDINMSQQNILKINSNNLNKIFSNKSIKDNSNNFRDKSSFKNQENIKKKFPTKISNQDDLKKSSIYNPLDTLVLSSNFKFNLNSNMNNINDSLQNLTIEYHNLNLNIDNNYRKLSFFIISTSMK